MLDYGYVGAYLTPTSGQLYPASKLATAEAGYRKALDAKLGYAERSIAAAYGQAFSAAEAAMVQQVKLLEQELAATGSPALSRKMQMARLERVMNQYAAAIQQFSPALLSSVNQVHQAGIQAALQHTPVQQADYMGGKAPTGVTLPSFGPETWGTVNMKAFQKAVGYMNQQDAPLRELVNKLGTDTLHAVQKEWAKGFGLGYNPNKIARNIKNATANIALGRAKTIARTELHRAYRQTKYEQQMASDVIKGWVWKAQLDGGTCAVCVAMAGSLHPKEEILDGHPNCRCVMVPLTKTWDELGFPGVPGDYPAALSTPNGPEWFSKLPKDMQKGVLGPTRHKDYELNRNAGLHPTSILKGYVRQTSNPTWGPMKQLAPIKGGKMAKGGAVPPAPVAPAPPKPSPIHTGATKTPAPPKPAPVAAPATPKSAPKLSKKAADALHQTVSRTGMVFKGKVRAATTAATKKGHDWLNKYNSASSSKDNIAKTLAEMSRPEYDKHLAQWDGRFPGYQQHGEFLGSQGVYIGPSGNRWQTPMPWSQMSVAERQAFLAGPMGADMRYDIASRFVQTWAGTSADNSPLSLLAQMRAEGIFGLDAQISHLARSDPDSGWQRALAAPKELVGIMDSTLRSMYRNTQEQFAAEGITSIKLSRGQTWNKDRPASLDGMYNGEKRVIETAMQPMSSWSSSGATANQFAGGGYGGSYILTAEFPVSWIVGSARTGFGCLHESEFVVMSVAPIEVQVKKKGY